MLPLALGHVDLAREPATAEHVLRQVRGGYFRRHPRRVDEFGANKGDRRQLPQHRLPVANAGSCNAPAIATDGVDCARHVPRDLSWAGPTSDLAGGIEHEVPRYTFQ